MRLFTKKINDQGQPEMKELGGNGITVAAPYPLAFSKYWNGSGGTNTLTEGINSWTLATGTVNVTASVLDGSQVAIANDGFYQVNSALFQYSTSWTSGSSPTTFWYELQYPGGEPQRLLGFESNSGFDSTGLNGCSPIMFWKAGTTIKARMFRGTVTGYNGTASYSTTKAMLIRWEPDFPMVLASGSGSDSAVTLGTTQTITGIKTFDATPLIPNAPTADTQAVNKKYVDDVARYIGVVSGKTGIINLGSSATIDIPDGLGTLTRGQILIANTGAAPDQGTLHLTMYQNYSETDPYLTQGVRVNGGLPLATSSTTFPLNSTIEVQNDLWAINSPIDRYTLTLATPSGDWSATITMLFLATSSGDRSVSYRIEINR